MTYEPPQVSHAAPVEPSSHRHTAEGSSQVPWPLHAAGQLEPAGPSALHSAGTCGGSQPTCDWCAWRHW